MAGNDAKKLKWLEEISPRFKMSTDAVALMDARKDGQRAIGGLDAQKDEIREAFLSIEVRVKGSGKMKLLDADGDYRKEIDTVHHTKDIKDGMSSEQLNLIKDQLDKISAVREQLGGNPYYDPGEPPKFTEPTEPVYTDDMTPQQRAEMDQAYRDQVKLREKEEAEWAAKVATCERHVTEDLYTPLVREGIIPENFVPQKHSEVAMLFDNAASAYDERLEEYSADLTEADILQEKFDLGFKIGQSVLKLAGSAAGAAGSIADAVGDSVASDGAELAGDVFEYMGIAVTLAEGVTKAVLTEKDMINVGLAIADAAAAALGKASDSDTAGIITRVIENGARSVRVGRALQAPPNYEQALTLVVEGISGELAANDPDGKDGLMTEIGGDLESVVAAAFAAKNIKNMVDKGASPLAILAALVDAGTMIAEKGLTKTGLMKEPDEEDGGDEGPDLGELSDELSAGLAGIKRGTDMDALAARSEAADRDAAETMKRSAEEAAEAEKEQFEHHLRMGFPLAADDQEAADIAEFDRINSIEYLIAMQKKNEATFKICETIASKGIGFVEKLFPPAGLAQAVMTLALTIKNAIEQTQEMILWRENVEDAMTAVSPQVDAMLNRSGLQTKQAMQAQVQTALDAAKVVAQVLAMTPAAPAAPIIEATVETAEAAIELADLIYTEAQLAKAWRIYEEARAIPEDRYLARKALRENPTLSKYAMAYGALNGDPVAMEGMRRCGLNKQVLSNPDTNISKVVTYLESKYADDPVLLRAVPVAGKWYPGDIKLTAKSWAQFYQAAITDADLDPSSDTSGIAAALGRLDEAETAFDAALDEVAGRARRTTFAEHKANPVKLNGVARDTLSMCLMQFRDKISGYSPVTQEGRERHVDMLTYVDALRAMSEMRSEAIKKIERDAPWVRELQKDTVA